MEANRFKPWKKPIGPNQLGKNMGRLVSRKQPNPEIAAQIDAPDERAGAPMGVDATPSQPPKWPAYLPGLFRSITWT